MNALFNNLEAMCAERGMSVAKLEKHLGLPVGYLYKWKTVEPGVYKVKVVADALGVKVDDLLG